MDVQMNLMKVKNNSLQGKGGNVLCKNASAAYLKRTHVLQKCCTL